jgi:hypothetical protein
VTYSTKAALQSPLVVAALAPAVALDAVTDSGDATEPHFDVDELAGRERSHRIGCASTRPDA